MKYGTILTVLISFLLVGCLYEAPLIKDHRIPIDPAVLGLWEPIQHEGEEPKHDKPMIILRYSDSEYLVHIPAGKGSIYFRGYPINIGNISCVQLQNIGTQNGPLKKDTKELFHVVSYKLRNGKLEIKTLNTDLVDEDLQTTEALVQVFLKHKDNKELFIEPERFNRPRSVNF